MKILPLKSLISIVFASLVVASLANAHGHKEKKDIVDVAASNSEFSTLVAAVKAAGLVDALKAEGPITVFAPNNAAFDKLPEGTVESLLKPENKDTLIQVLTYHVVPGKVDAAQVVKLNSAETLLGQDVSIKTMDSKVMINNAEVLATDVMASNGIIHVIDTVIMPKK